LTGRKDCRPAGPSVEPYANNGIVMNHRHRKILHSLFAHPISANISFTDVMHTLEELGAKIENKTGNRVGVTLNGHTVAFTHAQHSLPKDEVVQIRKFLETCGVDISQYPV